MTDRKTVICPHCGESFYIHFKNSPRRETAINYIVMNPDVSTKELAEKLGTSLRQAQYYKKSANEIKDIISKLYFSLLLQDPLRNTLEEGK